MVSHIRSRTLPLLEGAFPSASPDLLIKLAVRRRASSCNGILSGVRGQRGNRKIQGRQRCVATGNQTWVSGISLLRHYR